jgi:2-polyprenyl-3-methyl-5-hydroxy-6-metoxy-1,4-benzoquinol methylase
LGGRSFDIRIRAETVREFLGDTAHSRILDIGCGDGSISLPLLTAHNRITLMDLSTAMTAAARQNIPEHLTANAEVVNEDFMKAELEPHSYDVILCLGVLAHVDSPPECIARLATLLRPGGKLILELTDSQHFAGMLTRFYQWLCALRKPRTYSLNKVSFAYVGQLLRGNQLRMISFFRYYLPSAPLIHNLSQDTRYRLIRRIFGTSRSNRAAWLGNEYICLLTSDHAGM